MRTTTWNLLSSVLGLGLVCGLAALWPGPVGAQVPYPFSIPTTPDAQRNALNSVRSQVKWLQNTTRTAPTYPSAGYDRVWQQFQMLRGAYGAFKNTLTPRQLEYGANEIAELDAGLDILEEAFGGYQEELAAGRSSSRALQSMCRVLGQAAGVWLQELNKDSARLRVGWL